MVLDDKFFEGEEINGFYVEPLMKHAWAAQMELLSEVDEVCQKYGIRWFAEWGTLLGAVRHKGFIPWDDDIDIAMLRHDYKRFLEIPPEEWPNGIKILNESNNPGFTEMLSRVVNTMYINWSPGFLKKYHDFPFQIGIDIYPLDYIPRNRDDYALWVALIQMLSHAASLYRAGMEGVVESEREAIAVQIEEILGTSYDRDGNMNHQILEDLDKVLGMYTEADADEVGFGTWISNSDGYRHCSPKTDYDSVIMMPFENTEIPVPIGYDEVLKRRFGDYHKFVISTSHEYPFYRKQQKMLAELIEKDPQNKSFLRKYL